MGSFVGWVKQSATQHGYWVSRPSSQPTSNCPFPMPNYQLPTTKTVKHENKCYELLKRVINTQQNIGECFL